MIHASGFPGTQEGTQIPMRILKIIDAIPEELEQKPENYVAIINQIDSIVKDQTKFENVYHINELVISAIYYIPEFNSFKEIHSHTVWHLSDMRQKKIRRECSLCNIN